MLLTTDRAQLEHTRLSGAGIYEVVSSIGQSDADKANAGGYTLGGGFWGGGAIILVANHNDVFLPLVLK